MQQVTLDLPTLLAQLKSGLLVLSENLSDILHGTFMPPEQEPANANAAKLYEQAKKLIGTDASPNDAAPDNLACAETVNRIVALALGAPIGGGTSTYAMWQVLRSDSKRWTPIMGSEALPGDIIISPTGGTTNARLEHGHVGIVAKHGILSNNSENGLLCENYDIPTWKRYYSGFGLLPTLFYRVSG